MPRARAVDRAADHPPVHAVGRRDELSGGSRLAVDAAARIRAGVTPFGVPNSGKLEMAQAVASGAQFPSLILVTTDFGGDNLVRGNRNALPLPVRACQGERRD